MKDNLFIRCPENPIVWPGLYDWRRAVVFNPGAIYDNGKFYLLERAAGGLRPFHCSFGLLESEDGVHFRHVSNEPVFTPAMAGSPYGSVQDARLVKLEGAYYMTCAFRPYAWNCNPTGVGAPEAAEPDFPGFSGRPEDNQTRSGIAVSHDLLHWRHIAWTNPPAVDDRDVVLFPEKIGRRYYLLRRPLQFTGPDYGTDRPSIWITSSYDLQTWSEPRLLIKPEHPWESNRIGASAPPLRTPEGWLLFYHGVEDVHTSGRGVAYRMGALLLDLENPARVLARTAHYLMEPETYYEKFGLFIPNVIFPTGAVVRDGVVYLYYGVADTAIALATAPLSGILEAVLSR